MFHDLSDNPIFLLVLQTCIGMKLALNIWGKYPWIPNMFGEAEVSLGLYG